jgi:hypothetical protein
MTRHASLLAALSIILCAALIAGTAIAAPPEVIVKQHNGRPTVFADGVPLSLTGYSTFGERAYKEHVPDFFPHGTQAFYIEPINRHFWTDELHSEPQAGPDEFTVNDMASYVLEGDPNAWIIVRFGYWNLGGNRDPGNSFMTETGDFPRFQTASLADDQFWENVYEFTANIIRYCESRPWSDRVLGYADFMVTEGSHMPLAEKWLFDHSPHMLHKWREYLKEKYQTVEALRAAHGDPDITFTTVMVPIDKIRGPVRDVSELLYWQDRTENVELRDYLELVRTLFFEHFREINRAINENLDREALVIYDNFKQVMQGWEHWGFFAYNDIGRSFSWSLAFPEYQAGSGQIEVSELFDLPGFDGLITPHDYYARGIGGVYEPEGIADTMVLRGKFFHVEMDTRSHLKGNSGGGDLRYADGIGQARNIRDWEAITWRNLAAGFTRGFHSYWMEFGGGWFHDDAVQKVIGRQIEVMDESVGWIREDVPGIAMIIDDTAVLETNGNGAYLNEAIIWEWKMGMARCGVPHRKYLFDDLKLDNFPEHTVFYFPNLFRIDEERMALLEEKVFRDGNVVLWGPGSGISMGGTIGIEGAEMLTGFKFQIMPENVLRRVLVKHTGHPVTAGMDESTIYGGQPPYGPLLLPLDGEELGMAWTKGGWTYSGLVLREFGRGGAQAPKGRGSRGPGDWTSVYTTAVQIPADLWRNLARHGGAHIYTEANDVIMADRNMVSLHSIYSGRKKIMLPEKRRVIDVVTGKQVSRNTNRIVFDLEAPETRIFRLE